MKKVTLEISEGKYDFFVELIKNFDFVNIASVDEDTKEQIKTNLTKAFKDLKQYKESGLKTTSAQVFLDEL